jgi:hypothetical protein
LETITMTTPELKSTTNLNQYGDEALPWDGVLDVLNTAFPDPPVPVLPPNDVFTVLGTVRPDGRPHAAAVGSMWIDGAWWIVSGPGTQKSRNLEANPVCTLTARLPGIDVVFAGEARRVTDTPTLTRIAAHYHANGWPVEVDGEGFTAPYTAYSGGPPPWNLYRLDLQEAVGVGTSREKDGATRWNFA